MKTIVIGLGNPIMADDGVGICAVQEIEKRIGENHPDITCREASMGGLKMVELMIDYDRAIIIDAIQTNNGKPGEIYELSPADFPKTPRFISIHDIAFPDALKFIDNLGLNLPKEIVIIAVEAQDVSTFTEKCTPPVEAAISKVVEMVMERL